MVCDTTMRENQTKKQREAEIKTALARLEAYLATQTVTMTVGSNGAVTFNGWKDRDAVNDACAYRKLSVSNTWAFRQAKARAETMAGRKIDERKVAQGVHSHDGGKTWDKGH